jgi:putative serine protease PepD
VADDDESADGPHRGPGPLPPEDRIWRHPSELGAARPARAAPVADPSPRRGRSVPWWSLPAAFSLGVILALAAVSVAAPPRAPAERVVELVEAEPGTDPGRAAQRVLPATVSVTARSADGTSQGSGIIFRSDGHVLTTGDLVVDADDLSVTLPDGEPHPVELVGVELRWDIAVLKLAGNDWPTAVLGDADELREGERVIAVGASSNSVSPPLAGEFVVRSLSTGIHTLDGTMPGLLSTTGPPMPMPAGSTLVDQKGAVVGIVTGRIPDPAASTTQPRPGGPAQQAADTSRPGDADLYAVSVADARRVAEHLIEGEPLPSLWLGAHTESQGEGLVILDVTADSPADDAGLRAGDVLVSIDGQRLSSPDDLLLIERRGSPDTSLILTVQRGSSRTEVEVTLAAGPSD